MPRYGKGASCPSKIEQQDIYIFGINFPRYDINWKSIDAPETSRKKKEKKERKRRENIGGNGSRGGGGMRGRA